jgi:hypothetical protein
MHKRYWRLFWRYRHRISVEALTMSDLGGGSKNEDE